MAKIRVQDLARMMGVANQDLLFKLRSIGVRVEGEEAAIDKDVIEAILQGKKLRQPREVILRDDSLPPPRSVPTVHTPVRRPASNLRPGRRQMIQRVEPRIRNIELKERAATPDEIPELPTSPAALDSTSATIGSDTQTATLSPTAEAPESTTAQATVALTGTTAEPVIAEKKKAAAEKAAAEKKVAAKTAAAPVQETPVVADPVGVRAPSPPPQAPSKPRTGRAKLISRPSTPMAPILSGAPGSRKRTSKTRTRERGNEVDRSRSTRRSTAPSEPALKPSSARGRRRSERKQEAAGQPEQPMVAFKNARPDGPVTINEGMTVRDFAEKLGIKVKDLIKMLFSRGMLANINHVLDPETAASVATELGVETLEVSFEEEIQLRHEPAASTEPGGGKIGRPPVVTVMGHVDHGKTTLLDAIRSANVAAGEAGGITQHIAAYHVDVNDRQIVFLDTPGHEAFTMMRARGTRVTDVVVLVVAADDGVMPQTLEAIDHAKAAEVPLIVAINKVDKPNANLDRVKKELSDHGLLVEDWGGDTVAVPISALQSEGIDGLLEMILLSADLLDLKSAPSLPAQGAVIEARKEVGRGIIATILVQDGTLEAGDVFVAGSASGRVRSMTDDRGEQVESAGPSTPIEVAGFNDLPAAGDLFQVVKDESEARSITELRRREIRQRDLAPNPGRLSLEQLFSQINADETKELPIIIKADVQGSVEVLRDALTKISTEKVKVKIIHASVGGISTKDVMLASASNAIIIGFNVRPERSAAALAEKEQVDVRLHTVIYELGDELKRAMTGLLDPTFQEVHKGTAEVRQTFSVPKIGVVAGCHITDGIIPRNAGVRLLRDSRVIYEGKIASLRRFKDDVTEVRSGFDCGIGLENFQDCKPGDSIEAFAREEIAPTL